VDAGALPQVSEYDEVVFYSAPCIGPRCEGDVSASSGPPGGRITRYHGWIYSKSALPVTLGEVMKIQTATVPPHQIGGLPLVGHEEMSIHWRSYAEYLSAFYSGEEALIALRKLLFGSFSGGLLSLIKAAPPEGTRLRLWWVIDAPEIEDIPWEPLAHGQESPLPRLSIVRGRPPVSVPPLPIAPGRRLTIAVVDPAGLAPEPLGSALDEVRGAVEIVRLDSMDPREALHQAARAGAEIVHLVADASVPLGVEGLLDFSGGATLTPMEASQLLRGSRVAILSLSAPANPHVGHDGLPTVFHGFARFGRAIADGLTVVAPLGPIAPPELGRFWREFYRRFAEELDVEDALAVATPCPLVVPVVLFLRHRIGRQFTRRATDPGDVVFDPGGAAGLASSAQVSAELAISGGVLEGAIALQNGYAALGRVFSGKDLIDRERERQSALASYLDDALSRGKER
jgi:hypothetical protein